MTQLFSKYGLLLFAVLLLGYNNATSSSMGKQPGSTSMPAASPPDKTTTCKFDPAWLQNKSTLPTQVGANGNCSFHQFMWQSLAYLVQPSGSENKLRFESWMPTYGIFVSKGDSVTAWGDTPPTSCPDQDPATAQKSLIVYSDLTKQAGVEQPLLDDNKQMVYYGISLNQTAYDMVTQCDLYRFGCAAQLADQTGGLDLINDYPQLAFPTGSVELKTAWKVLTETEIKSGTFYTALGLVQAKSGAACVAETLGLVGLHIVSNTANHPEFIWATFEHKNNAPNCTDLTATPPLGGDWSFFNEKNYQACSKQQRCTNSYVPGEAGVVCRAHPYGDPNSGYYPGGTNCTVDPNQRICKESVKKQLENNTAAMIAINESAATEIKSNPKGSQVAKVWANYELVGNLWTNQGALPPISDVWEGSLSAANSTMETYVQDGIAGVTNPNGCFSCHDMVSREGQANLPPVGISHIFHQLQPDSGGCSSPASLPKSCQTYITEAK